MAPDMYLTIAYSSALDDALNIKTLFVPKLVGLSQVLRHTSINGNEPTLGQLCAQVLN